MVLTGAAVPTRRFGRPQPGRASAHLPRSGHRGTVSATNRHPSALRAVASAMTPP